MAIQATTGFLATSLNVAKRTRAYPIVTAIGAVASVAGAVTLIPRLGMLGAALATVAGQTAATAAMIYFAQRAYHIPYESWRLAKLAGVTLAAYFTMTFVGGPPTWPTLAARLGLIALVPVVLIVLRFFEPHELAEVKQAVAALGALRRREVTR
jgi:O-antigen/teichoic acid export membrane protein